MTYTKVSVLIPTRHRVARLRTLLESYERTVGDASAASELVFRVDDDDRATQDFLLDRRGLHLVIGSRLKGYDSLPTFFNEMLLEASGDVLLCGNDDMVFKTPRWAPLVLEAANLYPDGLFDLGVTTHNEAHYPFSIVSRKAVDRLGFIWDPRIFWGDIYLRDVMGAFGRCVMVPSVEIEHDWAGKHPDAVFDQADKDITARDPDYWPVTHARAVNDAVTQLRGIQ